MCLWDTLTRQYLQPKYQWELAELNQQAASLIVSPVNKVNFRVILHFYEIKLILYYTFLDVDILITLYNLVVDHCWWERRWNLLHQFTGLQALSHDQIHFACQVFELIRQRGSARRWLRRRFNQDNFTHAQFGFCHTEKRTSASFRYIFNAKIVKTDNRKR